MKSDSADLEKHGVHRPGDGSSGLGSDALRLLDTIDVAAVLTDLNGHIRGGTAAFLKLSEYNADELRFLLLQDVVLGLMVDELIDDSLCDEVAGRLEESTAEIHPDDALCIVSKNGDLRWVHPHLSPVLDHNDRPVARLFVLHDITAVRNARQAAEESDLSYRMLVEQANTVVMQLDADLSIRFINEYGTRLFGYSREELVGQSLLVTLMPKKNPPETADPHARLREVAAAPELHGEFDQQNRCSDGTLIWMHWAVRAVRNEEGGVEELLCIGTDITRRKKAELRADRYLRRSRHLADKLVQAEERERARIAQYLHDQVIQMLSLANIRMGGIHDALKKLDQPEEADRLAAVRHLVEDAVGECRSMMNVLVPTLLHEVGLGAALTHLAQQEHVKADASIRVDDRLNRQPLPPHLVSLLFQSARELVMNALKYAGPCEITITIEADADSVQLVVADSGCGFSVEQINRRIESEAGGFGLFNIRERLNGLGGTLTLDSAPGKGTRATIIIQFSR